MRTFSKLAFSAAAIAVTALIAAGPVAAQTKLK